MRLLAPSDEPNDLVSKSHLEPATPFGSMRNSGPQSIPSTTATQVTSLNISDGLEGGMAWSNNRFTVPKAGVYNVTARVSWQQNATGLRIFYIRKNGNTIGSVNSSAMSTAFTMTGSLNLSMNAGDTVELAVWQSSGAALNIVHNAGDTGLTIAFLGAL